MACYGTAYDSSEATKARLDPWMRGALDIEVIWDIDVPSYVEGLTTKAKDLKPFQFRLKK